MPFELIPMHLPSFNVIASPEGAAISFIAGIQEIASVVAFPRNDRSD